MDAPTGSIEPQYPIPAPKGSRDYLYVVGFFGLVVLLLALTYFSYKCKRSSSSPTISFGPPIYREAASNRHLLRTTSRGLDDDILVTFPTFLYSDESTVRDENNNDANNGSAGDCSICLVNYKREDVVRKLPECGHLFHVRCVDTWLKAHPTCPVCRKSPLVGTTLPYIIN
uniref:RING-H2 finger protein ATL70-like n=1 Tax=Erigeron canadensis TaxID=72917 RepID=UPI001CB8A817|nr:RING-H2 finger protein ATL70-like [Erigeron canadensis]